MKWLQCRSEKLSRVAVLAHLGIRQIMSTYWWDIVAIVVTAKLLGGGHSSGGGGGIVGMNFHMLS